MFIFAIEEENQNLHWAIRTHVVFREAQNNGRSTLRASELIFYWICKYRFILTCTDCNVQKQVQHDMKRMTCFLKVEWNFDVERSEHKGLSLFTFHFVKSQQFPIKANMLRNVKMSFKMPQTQL